MRRSPCYPRLALSHGCRFACHIDRPHNPPMHADTGNGSSGWYFNLSISYMALGGSFTCSVLDCWLSVFPIIRPVLLYDAARATTANGASPALMTATGGTWRGDRTGACLQATPTRTPRVGTGSTSPWRTSRYAHICTPAKTTLGCSCTAAQFSLF